MEEELLLKLIKQLRERKHEWNTVDAKQDLYLEDVGSCNEFIKDVAAMANNGEPSYLVIGLVDGTFADFGKIKHKDKDRHKRLNDILKGKIDPPISVDYREFKVGEAEYALIEIVGRTPPYVIAETIKAGDNDRKKTNLVQGTIHLRHADGTKGATQAEVLNLYRGNEIRRAFTNESHTALQLALQKPQYWEYLLTAELLKTRYGAIKSEFINLSRGLTFVKTTQISEREFLNWFQAKLNDLTKIARIFMVSTNEDWSVAWGALGTPGDANKILEVVNNMSSACKELLQWERDVTAINPPDKFANIHQTMLGCAEEMFESIQKFPFELEKALQQDPMPNRVVLDLVLEAPKCLESLEKEVKKVTSSTMSSNGCWILLLVVVCLLLYLLIF